MEFNIDFTVDKQHFEESLKALISTIFFFRTFGNVVPETREFMETPYPYIDIPEVSQSLAPLLTETPYEDHSLTILVRFFEHRKKSWFVSEEPFETWCLSLSITSINQEELNDRFASTVMKISELMDEHKEHIPIITNADLIPFEYTIQRGDESWKGYIKKMLDH